MNGGGRPTRSGAGDGTRRATGGVAVAIVTHDSATDLPACLASVAALEPAAEEVVIVDCASADASAEVARRELAAAALRGRVIALAENRGFTGGMNRALAESRSPYVLSLNPDARPAPDYAERLAAVLEKRPRAAAATGRLLRFAAGPTDGPDEPDRLDACGMRLTRTWRHLDRGSGEVDRGQYPRRERVFGATGAASLFRRSALTDVAVGGEAFDERFHSFREDAELAFRFAERGWEVIYEPAAVARHGRVNLPGRRRQMPPEVNRRSLQNRYLLRIYHQTRGNLVRTLLPTAVRDLAALAYVLVAERSSLPAYAWLWRRRRELFARRRTIQGRRTRPAAEVERWFRRDGEPIEES